MSEPRGSFRSSCQQILHTSLLASSLKRTQMATPLLPLAQSQALAQLALSPLSATSAGWLPATNSFGRKSTWTCCGLDFCAPSPMSPQTTQRHKCITLEFYNIPSRTSQNLTETINTKQASSVAHPAGSWQYGQNDHMRPLQLAPL